MARVGVLSFDKKKDRHSMAENGSLFSTPNVSIGFQRIISEAGKVHTLEYVGIDGGGCEFVLASLTSWYDVYNIIFALKGKRPQYKLIIGGPGVVNIYPLRELAYAVCVGRGEGLVNRIIDHDKSIANVWFRDDPGGKKYTIGQPTAQISGRETESVCGCPRKCYFCEYGWRYRYVSWTGQYSEYRNNETFFEDIDFSAGGHSTAGLDGLTERERWIVNKPLNNDKIIEKLAEHSYRDNYRLKLFMVTAYPFSQEPYDFSEIHDTFARAAKVVKNKITIMLSTSHFCPMPFTPMEEESIVLADRVQIPPRTIGKIKYMTYLQGTSYGSSVYESLLFRAREYDDIFPIVLKHKPGKETVDKISSVFPHVIEGGYVPADNIVRTCDLSKAKKIYKGRAYGNT